MAKRVSKRTTQSERRTNWIIIGVIVAVGVIGLLALLALSLQPVEAQSLADYCADQPEACVVEGNSAAPVTVVEVSDYGCSHCRNFHAETYGPLHQTYIDTGQVRWIFLPFALSDSTLPAANAAMCAAEQNAYEAMSDALFAQQGQPDAFTRPRILSAAELLGLDMEIFETCVTEGRYNEIIGQNVQAAGSEGVNATPTFFINGQKLEGAVPLSVFQQRIELMAQ